MNFNLIAMSRDKLGKVVFAGVIFPAIVMFSVFMALKGMRDSRVQFVRATGGTRWIHRREQPIRFWITIIQYWIFAAAFALAEIFLLRGK